MKWPPIKSIYIYVRVHIKYSNACAVEYFFNFIVCIHETVRKSFLRFFVNKPGSKLNISKVGQLRYITAYPKQLLNRFTIKVEL